MVYDHKTIEEMWLEKWHNSLSQGDISLNKGEKEKLYLLFAFAYPSGLGLHVGHVESKTALDILARFYRMNGKEVFFPVGWDAFGLPAENYAIKTGVHPAETTKKAIETFRRQIKRIGISYDWENEIATSHPEYYKWTQWLFLQFYQNKLAYRGVGKVNWCPSCVTVLANEQVVEGKCERCETEVVQKDLEQWYFKITEYKDELISGLDQVDWPEATKLQQLNWIGKSEGLSETWRVKDMELKIDTFTTWPHTTWGATFIVVAPEHPVIAELVSGLPIEAEVLQFCKEIIDDKAGGVRQEDKEKRGVFTGRYAINPLTGWEMPIYVGNFAIMNYGTGIVKGCPAHDERDFEFAKKYGLPIKRVIDSGDPNQGELYVGQGVMVNAGDLTGMTSELAREKIMVTAVEKGYGKPMTTYKLRDWLISRQRYWGAPIPVVYDPEGKPHPVKEEHLPWLLPTDVDFKPTGESPLKSSKEFVERTERLYGKGWRPEYDTMDTFVDSSWYYLRYADASNTKEFASKSQIDKWLPVDFYMIGPEHIVLHLLYSRFLTKFLRDQGYLEFGEPFVKMRHQGMILGPDGKKMSKSKGNVIDPDEVIEKFGADTLRMYEMFMGPLEADKPWSTTSVQGVYRFLRRLFRQVTEGLEGETPEEVKVKLHQTLKKVTEDLPEIKFNTAIAMMMELVNLWMGKPMSRADKLVVVKMLAPLAPFMAEEMFQKLQETNSKKQTDYVSVHQQAWPKYEPELLGQQGVKLVVQVNGRVRGVMECQTVISDLPGGEASQRTAETLAYENEGVKKWIEGKEIVKVVFVPDKGDGQVLLNLVVR